MSGDTTEPLCLDVKQHIIGFLGIDQMQFLVDIILQFRSVGPHGGAKRKMGRETPTELTILHQGPHEHTDIVYHFSGDPKDRPKRIGRTQGQERYPWLTSAEMNLRCNSTAAKSIGDSEITTTETEYEKSSKMTSTREEIEERQDLASVQLLSWAWYDAFHTATLEADHIIIHRAMNMHRRMRRLQVWQNPSADPSVVGIAGEGKRVPEENGEAEEQGDEGDDRGGEDSKRTVSPCSFPPDSSTSDLFHEHRGLYTLLPTLVRDMEDLRERVDSKLTLMQTESQVVKLLSSMKIIEEHALSGINQINKRELCELRGFVSPPPHILRVFQLVCSVMSHQMRPGRLPPFSDCKKELSRRGDSETIREMQELVNYFTSAELLQSHRGRHEVQKLAERHLQEIETTGEKEAYTVERLQARYGNAVSSFYQWFLDLAELSKLVSANCVHLEIPRGKEELAEYTALKKYHREICNFRVQVSSGWGAPKKTQNLESCANVEFALAWESEQRLATTNLEKETMNAIRENFTNLEKELALKKITTTAENKKKRVEDKKLDGSGKLITQVEKRTKKKGEEEVKVPEDDGRNSDVKKSPPPPPAIGNRKTSSGTTVKAPTTLANRSNNTKTTKVVGGTTTSIPTTTTTTRLPSINKGGTTKSAK